MASVTLVESAKLSQNELVAGVIENIITVDQMYQLLPFDEIEGNALAYNRENALGGVGVAGVGDTIGTDDANPLTGGSGEGKDAATFTQVTSSLTTILGDAEVNGLIQSTRSNITDQAATQIASKAKHVGRLYKHMFVNGDASGTEQFDGLATLVAAGQQITPSTNGDQLDFDMLDALADLVTAKDGYLDFYLMHARERRAYRALLRGLGGAAIMEVVEMPSGEQVLAYSGVPVFRNDYIPQDVTEGGSTDCGYVFAGVFDDGSRQMGVAGLTSSQDAGIMVTDVGESETKDEHIWRVKWYAGMALFSEKALAAHLAVTPSGA